jgi:hypothetical protein
LLLLVGRKSRATPSILSLLVSLTPKTSLWECVTAACKAFSLANVKRMGTNDWVIRSVD